MPLQADYRSFQTSWKVCVVFELSLCHSRAPESLREKLLHISAAQRTVLECLIWWPCVPGPHRTVTITDSSWLEQPTGSCTNRWLKHTTRSFCEKSLFVCPDTLAPGQASGFWSPTQLFSWKRGQSMPSLFSSSAHYSSWVSSRKEPARSSEILIFMASTQRASPDLLFWEIARFMLVVLQNSIYLHIL